MIPLLLCLLASLPLSAQDTGPARDAQTGVRRDAWQRPAEVMDALGVGAGSVVADIGAGNGYFTFHLGERVGSTGRVFAVEINEHEVQEIEERARKERLTQITGVLGATDDPRLPAGSLDAALVVNAYHEMRDYDAMLAALFRALKPGGRLGIIDAAIEPGESRESYFGRHRIPAELVREDAERAGFRFLPRRPGFTRPRDRREFYFLIFEKPQGYRKMGCKGLPAALCKGERVAAADRTACFDGRIDAYIGLVMLSGRAQDAGVLGQIRLRPSCHNTARTRASDSNPSFVSYRQGPANPIILHESSCSRRDLDHDVGSKTTDFEPALRIKLAKAVNGGGGEEVDYGRIKECPRWHRLLGDSFSVSQPLQVGPVLLQARRWGRGGRKLPCPAQHLRENLVEVRVFTGNHSSVRERNPHGRAFLAALRGPKEGGAALKELAPLARVLNTGNLVVGWIYDGIDAVANQASLSNLGRVQLLPHHGLDRITPQTQHRTNQLRGRSHAYSPSKPAF